MNVNVLLLGFPMTLTVRLDASMAVALTEHCATHGTTKSRVVQQSPFGAARQPPGMPQPLEVLPDLGVLLMEHLPGRPLAEMGPAQERHFDNAIRLLAELHSSGVTPETKRSSRGVVR